jgi:predicted transcriptional regulator
MEIPLAPDLQVKLNRLAAEQGRAAETLVVEALERLINYDGWFLREVEDGIAAGEQSELVEHSAIRKLIDRRYPA